MTDRDRPLQATTATIAAPTWLATADSDPSLFLLAQKYSLRKNINFTIAIPLQLLENCYSTFILNLSTVTCRSREKQNSTVQSEVTRTK